MTARPPWPLLIRALSITVLAPCVLSAQVEEHLLDEVGCLWPTPPQAIPSHGFYTDRVSYLDSGDTMQVFGNWPGEQVRYRILRIGRRLTQGGPEDWEEVLYPTGPANEHTYVTDQAPPFGSYVDFQNQSIGSLPDVSGWSRLTIEGWVYPTFTRGPDASDGDWVNFAGQMRLGVDGKPTGTAALGMDETGQLYGMIVTASEGKTEVFGPELPLSTWSYVGLHYNGTKLRLYHATEGSCVSMVDDEDVPSGDPIAADPAGALFRLGGRHEAPGDRTGCLSGRLDRFGVWESALGKKRLQHRMNLGISGMAASCLTEPPNLAKLRLFMDFEDAYSASDDWPTFVGGGNPPQESTWVGEVEGYGEPGVSGRPDDERALGLRHDQVMDAAFDEVPVTLNLPPLESGLYAIHAVFRDSGPCSGEECWPKNGATNLEPEHWRAFVVRPATPPTEGKRIAVIVPTLTWIAYNPWPGPGSADWRGRSAMRSTSADQTLDRRDPTGLYLPQGANSPYVPPGDGASNTYSSGLWRPNLHFSPLEATAQLESIYTNHEECWIVVPFFEWLEDPIGDEWNGVNLPDLYDTYTDLDLGTSNLDLTPGASGPRKYDLVVFAGKPEYVTEEIVQELLDHLDAGGSLLGVSGNTVVWKCATGVTQQGNVVFEARKWPCTSNLTVAGEYERRSWTENGTALGGWRFLEMCEGTFRDALFGTRPFQAGGFCGNLERSQDFGQWKVTIDPATHPYLAGLEQNGNPLQQGQLLEVGTVVGPEADAFYMDPGSTPPSRAIPVLGGPNGFPYAASGTTVTRLAEGSAFYQEVNGEPNLEATCAVRPPNPPACPTEPYANFQYIDWENLALQSPLPGLCDGTTLLACSSYASWAQIDPQQGEYRYNGFGNIVTYDYDNLGLGGGKVMHIASIWSPLALRNDNVNNNDVLSNIVGRFVKDVLLLP